LSRGLPVPARPSCLLSIKGFNKVILVGDVLGEPTQIQFDDGLLKNLPGLEFFVSTRRNATNDHGDDITIEDRHRIRSVDVLKNDKLSENIVPGTIVMVEGKLRQERVDSKDASSPELVYIVPSMIKYIGKQELS
jgi:single-stranded DNA-binding protein